MTGILSIGTYLPPGRVSADELARKHDVSADALRRFGIERKVVPGPDDHPSTLATHAARRALDAAGVHPGDVDLLVFAGVTRDRPAPWVAAFEIMGALGATRCIAFDIAARCPALIDAIWVARNLIDSQCLDVAVVCCGDRYDHLLPTDPDHAEVPKTAFGAAGSAVVLHRDAGNRITAYAHHVNPNLALHAGQHCPLAGGTRWPIDAAALAARAHRWQTSLTVKEAAELETYLDEAQAHDLREVCRASGFDTIDFFAGIGLYEREQLSSLAKLGIREEQVRFTTREHGHLGPSSPLVNIEAAIRAGQPVGPRLVLSMRSYVRSAALGLRGDDADLGIRLLA